MWVLRDFSILNFPGKIGSWKNHEKKQRIHGTETLGTNKHRKIKTAQAVFKKSWKTPGIPVVGYKFKGALNWKDHY